MYELQRAIPGDEEIGTLSTGQQSAAERLTRAIALLNEIIEQAVAAGLTVELARTRRSHAKGAWGDQVTAVMKS
jgi:hypothetical protein